MVKTTQQQQTNSELREERKEKREKNEIICA